MKDRIKLFQFSELLQVTILKKLSEKENDGIIISVYGYTPEYNHIEFSYELEFPSEKQRDLQFDEITPELLFDDVKRIITVSAIPILL